MFDFIGKMMVLQPPSEASFVAGEGYHPLLPAGPGLYVLREPTAFNTMAGGWAGRCRADVGWLTRLGSRCWLRLAMALSAWLLAGLPAQQAPCFSIEGELTGWLADLHALPRSLPAVTLRRDAGFVRQAVQQAISNLPAAGSGAMAAASTAVVPAPRKGAKAVAAPSRPVHSAGCVSLASRSLACLPDCQPQPLSNLLCCSLLPCFLPNSNILCGLLLLLLCLLPACRDAVWELMNCPHPLDTLADPAAYGDNGSISRYHNPDHYSRALGGVLRARGAAWRRLAANAGNVGMRHFAPVLDAAQQRTALTAAGRPDSPPSSAAPSAAERRMSPGGKQSLLPRLSPRGGGGSTGHLAA